MAKKKSKGKKKAKTYKIEAPKPKKITFWRKLTPEIKVLFGEHVMSRLTVVYNEVLSRRTPAIAIVAPIYANLKLKSKETKWTPKDLANIKLNGCYLHAVTKLALKIKSGEDNRIRPNCIYPTFLLEQSYVSLLIGNPCMSGNLTTPEDNLYSDFENLIKTNDGIIFSCNCKYASFWFDGKNFYCFCPEAQKKGHFNEITFILKSKGLQTLVEYIRDYLLIKGIFTLYCVKILSVREVSLDLKHIIHERKKILKSIEACEEKEPICEKPPYTEGQDKPLTAAPSAIDNKTTNPAQPDLPIRVFSKDYNNQYYDDRGFLSGTEYVKIPDKILHTNISCAIFLNSIKAMIWTKQGIKDILVFGNKLYRNSARNKLLDHPIWTQRIAMPIEFADKSYNVIFDKKVYGEVTSEEPHIFTLRRGIQSFFKEHDLGLVWGPQTQLIWSESNLYFTFSPKERDKVGRKWTKLLSSQIDPNQNEGAACVSWFKTPTLLADAFIANIPLKHRKDPYRIVKLKILEVLPVSQDFNNWKAIAENIWRIIGDKTICNYLLESDDESQLRYIKGFCIGTMLPLYCLITDCNDWTNQDIDDILEFGNQYYLESIELQPNLEKEFDFKELKKTFIMRDKRFQILFVPNAVTGLVFYSKGNQLELFGGLKSFFDDFMYGLFIVRDITIPIWSENGYYYLLYPYEKIFGKTNDCICGPETIYSKVYGHAYALRFKNVRDLQKELLNTLNMEDQDKYAIFSIEGKDRPPLLNYEQFGKDGAMLRPYDDLHEGHDIFNVRKDRQTYANIITCLCYAFITRPLEWSKDDILDILKIGDEIYCRIVASLENCKELYFFDTNQSGENKLSLIVPKIGKNKFTFEEDPSLGIFKYIPPQMEEEGAPEDEADDDAEDADTVYAGENEDPMHTNDLKYFLDQMDKNEQAFVLLDSKFFTVAIWKKDLVYFIFDPKASDPNGKLDENRMSKALKQLEGAGDGNDVPDIPHVGSAYVAYFYDKETLLDHILSKVPKDHLNEQIVFNVITIHSLPVPIADLDFKKPETVAFTSLSPNVAIVRATLSQDHPKFINQNKQEAANCLAAIIFAITTPSTKWSVSILDKILSYGDRLYIKSLEDIRVNDPARSCLDEKLTVEEILTEMYINKIKFRIKLKSKFTNSLVLNVENKEFKKLLTALKQVEAGNGAIIRIKDYTNAIWRSGPTYYLFDPVKTDPEGNTSIDGTASLMRFTKVDSLYDFLLNKFLCKIGPNNFEILTFEIEKTLPPALPEIYLEKFNFSIKLPSNQVVFVDIGNDMKVLQKSIEPCEMCVPKDYLCLAALVNSTILYIEFWNASVFKRITLLGYYLFQQLNCKTMNTEEDNEKHLEEINYSIKIDNLLCKIVVSHVIQSSIRSEFKSQNLYLRHGIESCFAERAYAIITCTNKSYALWRNEPYYYMFWSNEQIGKIMVQRAKDWLVFFNIILNESDIELTSTYQVKFVQISNIKMWDVCDERGPKLPQLFCEDALTDICRECNFNIFQKQTDKIQAYDNKHFNNFTPLRQGIDRLYSNIPLCKHKFYQTENFLPNIKATCIVAAGMSYIKAPAHWTKKTIKQIIHSGNELFMNSVAIKRTNNLDIINIEQSFNLYNVTLQIVALPPTQELAEIDNLVTVLTYILRKHKTAYLIFPDRFCLTLMLQDTFCYVFYPGSNEKFIDEVKFESASLLRFDNLIRTINFILLKQLDNSNSLFVGPIVVMGKW